MILSRIFDFSISLFGLLALAPVLIFIAIWIKLDSPGPVFFRQTRIGQFSRPFKIHKFRTMIINADSHGKHITIGDDWRITKSGAFLRRYKLDELPQLIDVLYGSMSLVGPRPEVAEYVDFYSAKDKEIIHSIRPGITDNASIEFRDESMLLSLSSNPEETYITQILPRKIELYKQYVFRRSVGGDILIIFKTIFLIFSGK